MAIAHTPLPFPRWIAHRGAGLLAPENTLAAFRMGARLGWRAFECDVKLSADGVPFLLHDSSLGRTVDTQAAGLTPNCVASQLSWARLSRLDAGRWHGPGFAGESLPTLETIARWCIADGHALNIEIKPTPGDEARTGQAVAELAHRLWSTAEAASSGSRLLLSSFELAALAAARQAAPDLPRALLIDELRPTCLEEARQFACHALVLDHTLVDGPALIARIHALDMAAWVYTVNETARAGTLLNWGIDAIITDAVDHFTPDGPAAR